MNIIPHVFGVFALSTWISSVQVKKKSNILILQLLANIFYAIQYFLLGYFSTGLMNTVSAFRCFTFGINAKKNKNNSFGLLLLILFIIFILSLIFCKTFLGLIPVFNTLLYTISTWQNNTKYLRYVFILCSVLFIFYNYIVGAYVALIGNIFEIISGILSIIRFKKEEKISN